MAELDGCLECNEGYNLPKGIFQASSTNQNINETIKIFAGIGARTIPSSAVPCRASLQTIVSRQLCILSVHPRIFY